MAIPLSLNPLSLNLPNSRISVDFSSFTTESSFTSTSTNNAPRARNFQYPSGNTNRFHTVSGSSLSQLPEVKEESTESTTSATLSRQNSSRWPWGKSRPDRGEQFNTAVSSLARTDSSTSMASTASTVVSSVFSRDKSTSTSIRTSSSSTSTRTGSSSTLYTLSSQHRKETSGLSNLPLSLLEHILSYALDLPCKVSIGPEESDSRHTNHRYHRAGLDDVDLRQVLNSPLFLVSRHMRETTLDVFHRKSDFVIDLHKIYHSKVSSTITTSLKRHQKFWMSDTPKMVGDSLRRLSKLHLRLPVPSTDVASHRGRDESDWMDGSDGKGGGNWKFKSMKQEQEDALYILECIEAIKELVMTDLESDSKPRPPSRSRSRNRSRSRSRSRSRMGSVRKTNNADTASSDVRIQSAPNTDDNGGKRVPLKRLEIVFVKRNPRVLVLPESLGPVRTFRSVPVSGYTRYYFELNGQRFLWTTKYRKKWQGIAPDGPRLLKDLQVLSIVDPPIEPIQTPTEFKFVKVDKKDQLSLLDTAHEKTPIVLETPGTFKTDFPAIPRVPSPQKASLIFKTLPWTKKKPRDRSDNFTLMMEEGVKEIGTGGTKASGGRIKAPTVDELKQIAEDIKNGLY